MHKFKIKTTNIQIKITKYKLDCEKRGEGEQFAHPMSILESFDQHPA